MEPELDILLTEPALGVRWLTLNHPPVNAIGRRQLAELAAQVAAAEADPQVRVVVISGAGRRFCAGADVREFPELAKSGTAQAFAASGRALTTRLWSMEKPTIAAMNGAALGGGMEIALACHLRIMAAGAALGLPEVNLGLLPGWGGTQLLPRLVGRAFALELLLTGEPIGAERAHAAGLVNEVVPAKELTACVLTWARRLIQGPALAQAAILRAVRDGAGLPIRQAGQAEEAALLSLLGSPDAQ